MDRKRMMRGLGALLLLAAITLFAFPEIRKPLFAKLSAIFSGQPAAASAVPAE